MRLKILINVLSFSLAFAADARPGVDPNGMPVAGQARSNIVSRAPIKILCIGDSMSDAGYNHYSASRSLMIAMRHVYGDGGQGLDGWYIGGDQPSLSSTRATPPGFFFSVSPVLYPGEEIDCVQASPDYYLETSYWMATNPYNKAGLFWYSYPGGGTFNVGITNYWTGTAELPTVTLSGYSAAPAIQYTNWPVSASGHLNMKVIGASGTNFLIGPEMANTNSGVEVFFFAKGGTGLTQWLSLGTNLLGQLWSEISPDLVIYHAKDYGPPPDLPPDAGIISSNFTAFISTLTNVTRNIVVVGTPPAGSFDGENPFQNEAEQAVADTNGFGFIDLYKVFPDFTLNQAAGLMADETHPSTLGASFWADEMARQLGFSAALSAPLRPVFQSVTQNGATITFSWSATPGETYKAQFTTNLERTWTDLGSSITATNNTISLSDSVSPDGANRFYRVRFSQ